MIPQQRAGSPRSGVPVLQTIDDPPVEVPASGRAAVPTAVGTGLLVLALGVLAVRLHPDGSSTAAWWPSAGVAAAGLALVAPGRRHLVLAAVAVGALATNLVTDRPWAAVVGLTLAHVLAPYLWIRIMTAHRNDPPRLTTVEDFGRLLVATLAGTGIAGLVAAAASHATEGSALTTWATFVVVQSAAIVLLVPFALALPPVLRRPSPWETGAQLVVLLAGILIVFATGQSVPLGVLPLPALMWAAARLPTRLVCGELMLTGLLTSVLTAAGQGPYAAERGHDPELVGMFLPTALIVYVLVTMPLSLTVHRQEQALTTARDSFELLQSVLVGATGTAIIGCRRDGVISFFNSGAERMLGYQAAEVVGRCTPEQFHDPAEVRARADELGVAPGMAVFTARVDAGAPSERRDWTMVRKDGTTLTVSLRVTARHSASGESLGYLEVGEDVTDRRRTELALRDALTREREARERLAQLDRAKTGFVGSISHELRTPLTSVLGFTEMVLEGGAGPVNDEQRAMLQAARRNGERLLRLIEDLLTVSLIEGGAFTTQVQPVDLRSPAGAAVEALQPLLVNRELELDVDLGARELAVLGDPDHLERLCLNLLTNAVKFTPDGGRIQVRAGVDREQAFLEVSDTGIGVPEEEQPQLFDRFFRASTGRALEAPGSGLGLAIVREIVSSHGGQITVRSSAFDGTTFRVLLPMRQAARSFTSTPVGVRGRHDGA